MEGKHIVKSFDQELEELTSGIIEMGLQSQHLLKNAALSLKTLDRVLAEKVVNLDAHLNLLRDEVDELAVQMILKRQPKAIDLRVIIASLKIAINLERSGDYASHVARHVLHIKNTPDDQVINLISEAAEFAGTMLDDALDTFQNRNLEKAIRVWHMDDVMDRFFSDLILLVRTHDMDPDTQTQILFIARNLERLGDHVANMANHVHYIITTRYYNGKNATTDA